MTAAIRLMAPLAVVVLVVLTARACEERSMGYMGVTIMQADDGKGLGVTSITSGGPAEKAGLKADDLILKLNGRDVGEVQDFVHRIKSTLPGTPIALLIIRDGNVQKIKVTLGVRPKDE